MKPKTRFAGAHGAFAILVALSLPAAAQSTWSGATGTDWNNPANWSPGIPGPGDNIIIADSTANGITLTGSQSIGSLTFGDTGTRTGNFSFRTGAANNVTIAGGIIANGAFTGSNLNLYGHTIVSADQVWSAGGSASHNTDQGIYVREVATATSNQNTAGHPDRGSLTLNGNLTKEGAGQMVFAGINATGSGNIVVNQGSLKFNAGQSHLLSVGGSGNLQVNNSAVLAIYRNSGTLDITRAIVMNDNATLSTHNGIVDIASAIAWNGAGNVLNVANNSGSHTNLTGAWTGSGTVTRTSVPSAGTPPPATLNLTGDASGFTGNLNLGNNSGITNIGSDFGGNIQVGTGATLAGEIAVAGDVSFNGSNLLINPATPGSLHVGGNLSLAGTTIVNFSTTPVSTAPFTVLSYGSLTSGDISNFAVHSSIAQGYRSPVFNDTGSAITLAVGSESRTWNGGGIWDVNDSTNWIEGDQKFYQFDAVTFGDTGAGNVALSGVLNPFSITIDSSSDYNFTAAGGNFIAGGTSLSKSGTGTATLGGVNTFTGGVTVSGGILRTTNNQALGANGQIITVEDGATLDFNGSNSANRDYHAVIAGSGAGGAGAVVNDGGGQQSGFGHITLAADATIGGTGRWDLRSTAGNNSLGGSLDLDGHTLTKTGNNTIAFVDSVITSDGSIHVNQGQLNLTRNAIGGAGSLDINPGATVLMENYNQTGNPLTTITKDINIDSATLQVVGSGDNFQVDSAIGLSGTATINTGSNLHLTNTVSGDGGILKTGAATLTLSGNNDYTGSTVIQQGTVALGASGSIAASTTLDIQAGAVLDVSSSQIPWAVAFGQTITGTGSITGNVASSGIDSIFAPGASPGTLTFNGNLDLSAGATFQFELGTASDLIVVNGILTGSAMDGGLVFNFSDAGGLAAEVAYTLFEFDDSAGLDYGDLLANTLPSGLTLDEDFGTGGWLIEGNSLQVQFIPEPSVSLLGGLGLLLVFRRRRA